MQRRSALISKPGCPTLMVFPLSFAPAFVFEICQSDFISSRQDVEYTDPE